MSDEANKCITLMELSPMLSPIPPSEVCKGVSVLERDIIHVHGNPSGTSLIIL